MNKLNPEHGMGWNKPDELREILVKLDTGGYLGEGGVDSALKDVAAHTAKAVEHTLKRIQSKGHGGGNWRRLIEQELSNSAPSPAQENE